LAPPPTSSSRHLLVIKNSFTPRRGAHCASRIAPRLVGNSKGAARRQAGRAAGGRLGRQVGKQWAGGGQHEGWQQRPAGTLHAQASKYYEVLHQEPVAQAKPSSAVSATSTRALSLCIATNSRCIAAPGSRRKKNTPLPRAVCGQPAPRTHTARGSQSNKRSLVCFVAHRIGTRQAPPPPPTPPSTHSAEHPPSLRRV
jgi:hypothetical protein